jgi:hypothetical protein
MVTETEEKWDYQGHEAGLAGIHGPSLSCFVGAASLAGSLMDGLTDNLKQAVTNPMPRNPVS